MTDKRPHVNSSGQQELDKAKEQIDTFEMQMKELQPSSIQEMEQQTKLSNREINKSDAPYIVAARTVISKEPFDEKWRKELNHKREYVRAIVENYEMIGEKAECWTKPIPGMPAEFWQVPANLPVMIPRHVAERLAACHYVSYSMDAAPNTENFAGSEGGMSYYGRPVATTKRRIHCLPTRESFVSMFS